MYSFRFPFVGSQTLFIAQVYNGNGLLLRWLPAGPERGRGGEFHGSSRAEDRQDVSEAGESRTQGTGDTLLHNAGGLSWQQCPWWSVVLYEDWSYAGTSSTAP